VVDSIEEDQIIFDEKFSTTDAKPFMKFSALMICLLLWISESPGATPSDISGKYDFLDNESIKTIGIKEDKTAILH
jgi:Cu+-exporting ATPase